MNLTRILTALAIIGGAGGAFLVLRPGDTGRTEDHAEARLLPDSGETEGRGAGGSMGSAGTNSHFDSAAIDAGGSDLEEGDAAEIEVAEELEGDVTAALVATAIEAMLRREARSSGRLNGSAEGKRTTRKRSRADSNDAEPSQSQDGPDPIRSKQLWQRARDARKAGNYEEALALLNESVAEDPLNKHAYRDLANLYRTMGMQAEELQAYEDWANAAPGDPLARYMMASAYERYGMDQEAYAQLAEFQRLNAGDVSTYPMAASMYSRLGLPEQQGAVLETWVNDVPDAIDARRALGQYYRSQGQHEAAIAQYSAATQLVPGNSAAHVDLAVAYSSLGEYDAALAELSVAADLRPGDLGIQLRLGDIYRRAGDPYAARDAYQTILEVNPNAPEARRAAQQINRIDRQVAANQQKPKASAG